MTKCWMWKKGKTTAGYGRLVFQGEEYYAHRISKALFENLPDDILNDSSIVFRHKCDTPACVNPDHIELGSQLDNIKDRVRRCRTRYGDRHPNATLTVEKVKLLRTLVAEGKKPKQEIAKYFGISPSTLTALIKGLTWKHVKETP